MHDFTEAKFRVFEGNPHVPKTLLDTYETQPMKWFGIPENIVLNLK